MTIASRIQDSRTTITKQLAQLDKVESVVQELGIEEYELYSYASTYGDASLIIDADGDESFDEILRKLISLGTVTKDFNPHSNQIEVHAEHKDGVIVTLRRDTPETCKVEKIEEEVYVPGRIEKQTKFKLVGDCLPLLAAKEPVAVEDATGVPF